ncbi:S8 family peptidase [Bacillus toyonensis]|uniref:S8 family peptidase n=1 Tax=Bacillus toyonensis TaxID=155322 RepID=UPI000698D3BC|nr:S8 family peptidase [Bacillus toyonensis]
MSGDFKHLELTLSASGIRRRRNNEFPNTPDLVTRNKENRVGHSQNLAVKATAQMLNWKRSDEERRERKLPELPVDKPLLIKIPPGEVDLDYLRTTLNLEVVCEYEDGFVIVATDEDVFNRNIEEKIRGFAHEIRGTANIAKVYDIVVDETKNERLKRILSEDLYANWGDLKTKQDATIIVEMSVECLGKIVVPPVRKRKDYANEERYNRAVQKWHEKRNAAYEEWDELCYERQREIDRFIGGYNGRVLEVFDYVDENSNLDSFEMKVEIPVKCLIDLAENYPYVFEITLPDEFNIGNFINGTGESIDLTFELSGPRESASTICVIDSGIQENHIYISQAIREDISKSYLPGNELAVDEVEPSGHGTRVSGAILYPAGISGITNEYSLPCFIANARILDENNGMPDEMLPSKVINNVVKDYNGEHGIRIFNHSIAASGPCRTKYMSSWATSIDNLSFEHDILFLQATGNLGSSSTRNSNPGIREHLDARRNYPNYLLEKSCRIANPAQSTQALTVGSICIDQFESEDLQSFGEKGSVSSFSRSGFGMWNGIKPEVVEYGGDWIRNRHNNFTFLVNRHVGTELIRRSPEGPAYSKDGIGTSFSTPKVANIAAQLEQLFPNNSSLLYRALIVQSARWTQWAIDMGESEYLNVLKYIGYGLPDVERATQNDLYRVTYMTSEEKEIKGGNVHVYRVIVPDEIKGLNAQIRIDITLAFSAKPRRTRKDFRGYFSTTVDWESSKSNEDVTDFVNRIVQSEGEVEDTIISGGTPYTWTIGKRENWGVIKGVSRNKSATQKDWMVIPAYDLPDDFCIAVIGRNGWSNTGEHSAKYSLVVGFEAIDKDVEIYAPFRVEVESTVEQEIQTEIQIGEV